ncbi:MAG: ribosome maturation factor RimM [Alphaproteobacteria bacterium]|nr:ribosome maturation factor RimM [Alphaproteobacteria bacterium]
MSDKRILIGRIVAAHGLKGEVKIKSFTEAPLDVASYGAVLASDGRKFQLVHERLQGETVIAAIKGINDRNSAETLRGLDLYVDRADLPEPEDDEFYHADLIDLPVTDASGAEVGRVLAFHNFGGGDVMEVKRGTASVFVPFTVKMVPTVDVKTKRVVLSADGLAAMLEVNEKSAAGAA